MNRNRYSGGRDGGRRSFGGGGMDGLLGEAPGAGGMVDQLTQMNQLMLAQQLLQKQAAMSAAGGDFNPLAMQMMQQQQQLLAGGSSGMYSSGDYRQQYNRKRVGQDYRDGDSKRRRRNGDHDRSRGGDRDRARSGRRESGDRDRVKKENKMDNSKGKKEDYDPAEPTEDDGGEAGKDKDLYCHVCSIAVYDNASLQRHLNGMKHKSMMNSVLSVHQMKSTQLQSRMKAEEHLRKIEGKAKKEGHDPDYFCKICNNDLTIPWDRHRFSNIHKQRHLQVKKGCGWCNVHDFNNFTDVLEHRETDDHKKNAELYGKKDEDRKERGERRGRNKKREAKEEEEDLTIPEYNPETPVGHSYIVQVTGYFCKLCNKFYNNEKSAKENHCQSETHYEKFKAAMEVKIAEREKRRAEKAAEEARRAAEEEEKGEGEVKQGGEDYNDELPLEDSDDEGGLANAIVIDDDDDEKTDVGDGSVLNETSANGSFTYFTGAEAEAKINAAATTTASVEEKVTDVGAAMEQDEPMVEDGLAQQVEETNTEGGGDAAVDKQTESEIWLAPPESLTTVGNGEAEDADMIEAGQEEADVSVASQEEADVSVASQDEADVSIASQEEADVSVAGQEDDSQGSDLVKVNEEEGEEVKAATPKATRGKGTARRGRGRGRGKK